jgi:hypothetical protein
MILEISPASLNYKDRQKFHKSRNYFSFIAAANLRFVQNFSKHNFSNIYTKIKI